MATVRHINYFPQCVQSYEAFLARTTGIATMTMNLEQAMAFFWRVKTFLLVEARQELENPPFVLINELYAKPSIYQSERSLVCGIQAIAASNAEDLSAGSGLFADTGILYKSENEESILVGFLCSMNAGENFLFNSQPYLFYNFDTDAEELSPLTGSGVISFLGHSFTFDLYSATGLPSSIEVEAAEYWPYDPGDGGGPIYDSVTGAQLRDFPS
jgi:hypothetical protein